MWTVTCLVLLAAGYAASVYSWPSIKVRVNGEAAEVVRLRKNAAKRETKLGNLRCLAS